MFNRYPGVSFRNLLMSFALLLTIVATGCTLENTTPQSATPQGTLSLDAVTVGMPESAFKDAILTFVPDPKGAIAGKVQYLSRSYDSSGGQVIAQCKDDVCFGLQIYHLDKPISKDEALKRMKELFPPDLPAQSKVDDKELKEGEGFFLTETYYFGNKYKGELIYTDKAGTQVKIVNAWVTAK